MAKPKRGNAAADAPLAVRVALVIRLSPQVDLPHARRVQAMARRPVPPGGPRQLPPRRAAAPAHRHAAARAAARARHARPVSLHDEQGNARALKPRGLRERDLVLLYRIQLAVYQVAPFLNDEEDYWTPAVVSPQGDVLIDSANWTGMGFCCTSFVFQRISGYSRLGTH